MTSTTIPPTPQATPQPNTINNPTTTPTTNKPSNKSQSFTQTPMKAPRKDLQKSLRRISLHPTLTPYRRRVYRALLSIPAGRWTTYSALAKYLDSSARAVGTAMRTNPFAPEVPCHRVLAADRTLGGYMGSGPASGSRNLVRKREMLEGEGVVFAVGRGGVPVAEGECFDGFCTFV